MKPQCTHDPFQLLGMEEAVGRILDAVDEGTGICVYGDYDADGVTATVLVMSVLRALDAKCSFYIPSRFDEGYSLNKAAIDRIRAAGARLILTVDCGCVSVDEVAYAKEAGLQIIVTDHHVTRETLPDCILIDPKQKACPYPFKGLAGVGVAFKLCQALAAEAGLPHKVLVDALDLFCIGTVGDVMPLIDENRTYVKFGIRALRLNRRPGLRALLQATGTDAETLDSDSLAYLIVPHINAAGRMGDATLAARLLLTKDEEQARVLAERLVSLNRERKSVQAQIYKRALERIRAGEGDVPSAGKINDGRHRFLFVRLEEAHEGVIGIACGRLKEDFGVPAIIVTNIGTDAYKGTGRSVGGINIYELLSRHRELFTRFGGHAAACGFTIPRENLEKLKEAIGQEMERGEMIPRESASDLPEYDTMMQADEIDEVFLTQQKLLEPFGKDNPKPNLGIRLKQLSYRRIGTEGQFLRMEGSLTDGRTLSCVDFKHADMTEAVLSRVKKNGNFVLITGNLTENIWRERRSMQCFLTGIKEIDDTI